MGEQLKLANKIRLKGVLGGALHGVARIEADAVDANGAAEVEDDKGAQGPKGSLAGERVFGPARLDEFQQGRLQQRCGHILNGRCRNAAAPPEGAQGHVLAADDVIRA